MLYSCSPDCTDPRHHHAAAARSAHLKAPSLRATSSRVVARGRKGKSQVVDLHCHYLNPEVNAKTAHLDAAQHDPTAIFANALTRETNVRQMKTRGPKLTGVDERLKDMDRMGVDVQAICPAPYHFFYFTEPDVGAQLAREVNEGIAKLVADTPDRFVGLGSVPLQDAELAVRELEYAVKNLGLRGVEICTNVNGRNLTDPALGLEKFFARAEELGILVFMHPLGYTQADRLTEHYFNNVIGNPLDSTVAVSHLIFDGTMARHPKLKVLVAHGGGFVAHYWARMDHAWRARPDCRTVIKRPPSKYLEKFYFDTITHDPQMLKHLVERFGADHVVLGTDYPYDMGDEDPLGLLAQVKRLPKAERDLIAGGNAARLLKLK
ncbi:amidohydrolase family protein [Ramlibacter alkalitolerans]|uniref:Amidohydrolase n=1 Tax=Ramlibacter alkalitolerans TaxID=2039631 RepID=A0ABS1JRY8_9BURK|nr:amidohydrolase family protein [Ramlibacter alkalitolerans]MBL0426983.1 amidohydrolase [Ramlibacter alkalitolerans]